MEPKTPLERLVLAHPAREWNWEALPKNPDIRLEFVMEHPDLPWDVTWALYENPRMTPEWLRANPGFMVDWNSYSRNPSITKAFLIENLDKEWNWLRLSSNEAITEDIVEELMDDPRTDWQWGMLGLSRNPNISYGFVEKHFDKPWHCRILSMHNQGLNRLRANYDTDTDEKSMTRTQKRTNRLKKQLMRATWHPERMHDWCLDEEEKAEMEEL